MSGINSKDERHLANIREKAIDETKDHSGIHFFTLTQMTEFLDSLVKNEDKEVKRIRGYRVKVRYVGEGKG